MKKRVIILSMLVGVITSCSGLIERQEKREIKQERRVNTLTVVDVNTGDTIQIEFSRNGGVPSSAYKIK
jgi:Na+-transporting methylmalonyl-CoA/oxaloacetate decarboxylase gamma subunit